MKWRRSRIWFLSSKGNEDERMKGKEKGIKKGLRVDEGPKIPWFRGLEMPYTGAYHIYTAM